MPSRGKWVINYKRFIPATILFIIMMFTLTNFFVASVNVIAAKYLTAKNGIHCSDYWGEIKLDLSYPLSKDELCLRIENYRPENVDITILVKEIWLNYTRIPVPGDLWIEPGETERLVISPGAEYMSCKCVVMKVWYSLEFSESIRCLDRKLVPHLSLLNWG